MTKHILVLNANPKTKSFCHYLADQYDIEASETFKVKRFNLADMSFNPSLDTGYDAKQALEPCLTEFQTSLQWADHLVIIMPIWWGGMPAKLKGLFDRILLPGFAFYYESGNPFPIPLLSGKTIRLIMTMDAPTDYLDVQAEPVLKQLTQFTFCFCGFENPDINLFGPMITAEEKDRNQWAKQVQLLGRQGR